MQHEPAAADAGTARRSAHGGPSRSCARCLSVAQAADGGEREPRHVIGDALHLLGRHEVRVESGDDRGAVAVEDALRDRRSACTAGRSSGVAAGAEQLADDRRRSARGWRACGGARGGRAPASGSISSCASSRAIHAGRCGSSRRVEERRHVRAQPLLRRRPCSSAGGVLAGSRGARRTRTPRRRAPPCRRSDSERRRCWRRARRQISAMVARAEAVRRRRPRRRPRAGAAWSRWSGSCSYFNRTFEMMDTVSQEGTCKARRTALHSPDFAGDLAMATPRGAGAQRWRGVPTRARRARRRRRPGSRSARPSGRP